MIALSIFSLWSVWTIRETWFTHDWIGYKLEELRIVYLRIPGNMINLRNTSTALIQYHHSPPHNCDLFLIPFFLIHTHMAVLPLSKLICLPYLILVSIHEFGLRYSSSWPTVLPNRTLSLSRLVVGSSRAIVAQFCPKVSARARRMIRQASIWMNHGFYTITFRERFWLMMYVVTIFPSYKYPVKQRLTIASYR